MGRNGLFLIKNELFTFHGGKWTFSLNFIVTFRQKNRRGFLTRNIALNLLKKVPFSRFLGKNGSCIGENGLFLPIGQNGLYLCPFPAKNRHSIGKTGNSWAKMDFS